jgi:hypothetical protein
MGMLQVQVKGPNQQCTLPDNTTRDFPQPLAKMVLTSSFMRLQMMHGLTCMILVVQFYLRFNATNLIYAHTHL